MSQTANIELTFSNESGAMRARKIAETLIRVYYGNHYEFLPFDDMKKVNADGYLFYPGRKTSFEKISSFTSLWRDYQEHSLFYRRNGLNTTDQPKERISLRGCRLTISDCARVVKDREFVGSYFEDFMSLLCLISITTSAQTTFEGMCRSEDPHSYAKKILTHIVYDGSALTFEQVEGDPVYGTTLFSWTRREDKLIRRQREFPFIRVDILTEDRDAVRKDKDLDEWIRGVNTIELEMRSAELCIYNKKFNPDVLVMIHASSRKLCEKLRDELYSMMEQKGYRMECFSIYNPHRFPDPPSEIPKSVTMLDKGALRDRKDLKQITLHEHITHIGDSTFEGCSSLARIMIPDSVKRIEHFAFMDCESLREVTLSQKLRTLEYGLFIRCSSLEQIELPDKLIEIEGSVFSGCTSLKSMAIPPKVRKIGDEVFEDCTALESVVIPQSVIKIGKNVFKGCSPDLIIRGKKDSAVARYAIENNITFCEIG